MRKLASLSLGLVSAAALAFACSSDPAQGPAVDEPEDGGLVRDGSTFDSAVSPESGLGELRFSPASTYSGYDGQHTFKVPIAVYDYGADLTVSVVDPSTATVTPVKLKNPVNQDGLTDNGAYFMVTVLKAGTVNLKATTGGKSVTTKITVADYPATQWTTGQTRYNSGGSGDPPCTDCHVNGQAIDHSPASLASATDEAVGTVITTGISTAGFPIMADKGHKWTVTDEERAGLVAYLRGLEPRGFTP